MEKAKKIGYARVSTDEQNLSLQMDALRIAGCATIYTDRGVSGSQFSRPGLDRTLKRLHPGDTLVVWRLDRLGRSLTGLLDLVNFLDNRSVQFASLTESINTNSPGGRLVFHMMAVLAEFERSLISERTRAGLSAARARGKTLGRRSALTPDQGKAALAMLKTETATQIAARFGVHPRTIRRLELNQEKEQMKKSNSS
ncbi:hypothetical protein WL93_00085 [Burkholderia diffusa]|nr:hypothetical protein WL93_00085 [Burkholderia diffusa]